MSDKEKLRQSMKNDAEKTAAMGDAPKSRQKLTLDMKNRLKEKFKECAAMAAFVGGAFLLTGVGYMQAEKSVENFRQREEAKRKEAYEKAMQKNNRDGKTYDHPGWGGYVQGAPTR